MKKLNFTLNDNIQNKDLEVNNVNLLDPDQVALYLGVSKETLNVWRSTKRYNIPYVKTGRLVRYKKEDLDKWIEERTIC